MITLKVASACLIFVMISSILIHAKTGFITKSFDKKIPKWDNTRELLDWGHIADILAKNLQKKELESLATLNWYDSGQLTASFYYNYRVGVIGPNGNHFKYIDLTKRNFTTLIDVQLIHSNKHSDLSKKILSYSYNITNKVDIPFYRGMHQYGNISVISLEKSQ